MAEKVCVIHKLEDDVVSKQIYNPLFLLGNKQGGYISLGAEKNISRYQGCFFVKKSSPVEWSLMKVIESIRLNKDVTHLVNNFYNVERMYNTSRESFFMGNNDAIYYEVKNFKGNVDIILDCREIFDFDDKGRVYNVYKEDDNIVVEYIKYRDDKNKDVNYKIYLVVKGCLKYKQVDKWCSVSYDYDNSRKTRPERVYVYHALRVPVANKISLVFGYGSSLTEAKENADLMNTEYNKMLVNQKEYITAICKIPKEINDEKLKLAYKCCIKSLNDLLVKFDSSIGIFGGFPWFFHFWTRDEAISAIGLMDEESYLDVKMILFRQLQSLMDDGRLPNRIPKSDLGSADAAGWCFKRIRDFMLHLKDNGILDQYFTRNDIIFVKEKLKESIARQLKCYAENGLIYNKANETWMDTSVNSSVNTINSSPNTINSSANNSASKKDVRDGFRIEVQALMLNMYKFMKELCKMTNEGKKAKEYGKLEKDFLDLVKKNFWKVPCLIDGKLMDGKDDLTARPNVFIAYYVYPELLKFNEWNRCFDYALKKLWLDWGGLSTIDTNHKLFTSQYTGEDNKSYHRGDSWFFLNCMAAFSMYRLDAEKYDLYITKIIESCIEQILFMGAVGHNAELSSAKELRSEGTFCQAWSAAMFIELINEIYF